MALHRIGLQETGRRFGRLALVEQAVFEGAGRWSLLASDDQACDWLARVSRQAGDRVVRFRELVPTYCDDEVVYGSPLEPLAWVRSQFEQAASDLEVVAMCGLAVLAQLHDEVALHLTGLVPVSDGPFLRALALSRDEYTDAISSAHRLVDQHGAELDGVAAQAHEARVQLAESGGLFLR